MIVSSGNFYLDDCSLPTLRRRTEHIIFDVQNSTTCCTSLDEVRRRIIRRYWRSVAFVIHYFFLVHPYRKLPKCVRLPEMSRKRCCLKRLPRLCVHHHRCMCSNFAWYFDWSWYLDDFIPLTQARYYLLCNLETCRDHDISSNDGDLNLFHFDSDGILLCRPQELYPPCLYFW